MMHLDKHNNLVIDDDDPQLLHEIHKENLQNNRQAIKHAALLKLKKKWEKILEDKEIDEYSKLTELTNLRSEAKRELSVLFPHSIDLVLEKSIDKIIKSQKKIAEEKPTIISKSDDYLSTKKKLTQTGKQTDIGKYLEQQLKQMHDFNIEEAEGVIENDNQENNI